MSWRNRRWHGPRSRCKWLRRDRYLRLPLSKRSAACRLRLLLFKADERRRDVGARSTQSERALRGLLSDAKACL